MGSEPKHPERFSISLATKEKRRIKVFCALESITLKEWYRTAFVKFLEKRRELSSHGKGYVYRARPAEAEPFSMVTTADVVDEMRTWARRDNVRYVSAYYTAVVEYLEQCEVNA